MDPQSQAFTPFAHTTEAWRIQQDVARIQQIQHEHSERIARLERKQDDDARMKSVWGNQSPFPSVLSGTPQQAPRDRFRDFDDDSTNNLMSSLHLDAEEEPRNPRGLGAASRANSVRFDETANQNHFAHSSRSSLDFPSRPTVGFGGLPLGERTFSHKSDGRASSVHSMRSAASGRANSLNLDGYNSGDSHRVSSDPLGPAPGLLLMGSAPAIIRCWMNTNFKHDALLYAAICTGSFKSYLDIRLIYKLGFEDQIVTPEDRETRSVELPVFFPEAVPHPASSRSSSPAPQLPTMTVRFEVIERSEDEFDAASSKDIQIFIGSDTLKAHNADVLFSTNTVTLFDDDRSKLNIPLVRPENEASFKSLKVTSDSTPSVRSTSRLSENDQRNPKPYTNGLGQRLGPTDAPEPTAGSLFSDGYRAPSPPKDSHPPIQSREAAVPATETEADISAKPNVSRRPPLNTDNAQSESGTSENASQGAPPRSGSSPAIWSNWRREAGPSTTNLAQPNLLDWAAKRKEAGIKILKPKSSNRTVSVQQTGTTPNTTATPSPGEAKSRFFDQGSRRGSDSKPATSSEPNTRKENQTPGPSLPTKTKSNPVGGASAFSWLNGGSER